MAAGSKTRYPETRRRATQFSKLALDLDPEDQSTVFQVCRNTEALFLATTTLHGLGERELKFLCAAALLHDIGHTVDVIGHHKHSRDLILKMELSDFSRREQRIVACVARYHRKAHPKRPRGVEILKKLDQKLVKNLRHCYEFQTGWIVATMLLVSL